MNVVLLAASAFLTVSAHAEGSEVMDQLFASQASMTGAGGSEESSAAAARHAFDEHSSAGAVRAVFAKLGSRG